MSLLNVENREKIYDAAEKIATVFELFNWHWEENGRKFVPRRLKIEEAIVRLVHELDRHEIRRVDSGGLFVELSPKGYLTVGFSATIQYGAGFLEEQE